jgi:hypothetical protein
MAFLCISLRGIGVTEMAKCQLEYAQSGRADTVPCDKPAVGICATAEPRFPPTAVWNAAGTHSAVSAMTTT